MKFTALPVNVGDSFLLQYNGYSVLVDGGMNQTHILSLLKKTGIKGKFIDTLICTHYDSDHINGILGLLKAHYEFNELWLPEIYGSIAYTFSHNIRGIIEGLRERKGYDELLNRNYSGSSSLPYGELRYEQLNTKVARYFLDEWFPPLFYPYDDLYWTNRWS